MFFTYKLLLVLSSPIAISPKTTIVMKHMIRLIMVVSERYLVTGLRPAQTCSPGSHPRQSTAILDSSHQIQYC